jgi:hypothetical protein
VLKGGKYPTSQRTRSDAKLLPGTVACNGQTLTALSGLVTQVMSRASQGCDSMQFRAFMSRLGLRKQKCSEPLDRLDKSGYYKKLALQELPRGVTMVATCGPSRVYPRLFLADRHDLEDLGCICTKVRRRGIIMSQL